MPHGNGMRGSLVASCPNRLLRKRSCCCRRSRSQRGAGFTVLSRWLRLFYSQGWIFPNFSMRMLRFSISPSSIVYAVTVSSNSGLGSSFSFPPSSPPHSHATFLSPSITTRSARAVPPSISVGRSMAAAKGKGELSYIRVRSIRVLFSRSFHHPFHLRILWSNFLPPLILPKYPESYSLFCDAQQQAAQSQSQ